MKFVVIIEKKSESFLKKGIFVLMDYIEKDG